MTAKAKKPATKPTPGKAAYAAACDAIELRYDDYCEGNAEDDDFTTPGKQKKVAKQLAKIHNRLNKKLGTGREDLDEDV